MKVDFIIAGAQKCGTTALHTFLSKHPKVIGSDPKETDFFNYDTHFNQGVKYYHSRFGRPRIYQLRGFKFLEASPSYINDGDIVQTANRIYNYNPAIKIVSQVRNPIDRAYSAWQMYRKWYLAGNINWWFDWVERRTGKRPNILKRRSDEYQNFATFIHNEIECLNRGRELECKVLNIGNYFIGIEIFQSVFGNNYLVVKNEELNNNTPKELLKISNFLNLPAYNWKDFNNVKVLQGNYKTAIETDTVSLLSEYYQEANKKLYNLTGISYI